MLRISMWLLSNGRSYQLRNNETVFILTNWILALVSELAPNSLDRGWIQSFLVKQGGCSECDA